MRVAVYAPGVAQNRNNRLKSCRRNVLVTKQIELRDVVLLVSHTYSGGRRNNPERIFEAWHARTECGSQKHEDRNLWSDADHSVRSLRAT
jgi:hypothetical protein